MEMRDCSLSYSVHALGTAVSEQRFYHSTNFGGGFAGSLRVTSRYPTTGPAELQREASGWSINVQHITRHKEVVVFP